METVGVEAIVTGLMQFGSDMQSIQNRLDDVGNSSTILGGAFEWVSGVIGDFGASIIHVAEYALGQLLADAIEGVLGLLGELAQTTLETGNEFQTLEIRLKNINFASLTDSGLGYNDAMKEAIDLTKEQLDWVIKLSVTTPFSAEAIAQIYAMGRSYDFTDEQTRKITEAVMNFTAAMGLSSVEAERIIKNFGQMSRQGRITQRDLNDLARGAFVPVNKILEKIRVSFEKTGGEMLNFGDDIKKLQTKLNSYEEDMKVLLKRQEEFGPTTKESVRIANQAAIDELKKKIADTSLELLTYQKVVDGSGTITKKMFTKMLQDGIPAEEFINGFVDMVATKFPNAAVEMARTFGGASENLKQLVTDIGGMYIIKPILDVLGSKLSEFVDQFTTGGRYEMVKAAFIALGEAISQIVARIVGLAPSASDMALAFIEAVNKIATWLNENQDTFVGWARDMAAWIKNELVPVIRDELVPWIRDELIPAVTGFVAAIWAHRGEILGFFSELGRLVGIVAGIFTDDLDPRTGDWVDRMRGKSKTDVFDFLEMVTEFIRDKIGPFLRDVVVPAVKAFVEWLQDPNVKPWLTALFEAFVALAVIQQVAQWAAMFVGAVLGGIAVIAAFLAIITSIGTALGVVIGAITGAIATVLAFRAATEFAIHFVENLWTEFEKNLSQTIYEIRRDLEEGDWGGVGADIIDSIRRGFEGIWEAFTDAGREAGNAIMSGAVLGVEDGSGALGEAIVKAASDAWQSFLDFWGIHSPSRLAQEAGQNIMSSFADSIVSQTAGAVNAMQKAAVSIASPMMSMSSTVAAPSTISTSYQNTNNYNLSINSNANTEPIIQDFNMLSSLAGT